MHRNMGIPQVLLPPAISFVIFAFLSLNPCYALDSSAVSLHEGYRILRGKTEPQTSAHTYDPGTYFLIRRKPYPSNMPRISPLSVPTVKPIPCLANKKICRELLEKRNDKVLVPLHELQVQIRSVFEQLEEQENLKKRKRLQRDLSQLQDLESEIIEKGEEIYQRMKRQGCFPCPKQSVSGSPTPSSVPTPPKEARRRCMLIKEKLAELRKQLRKIDGKIVRVRKILRGKKPLPGKNKKFFNKELRRLLDKEEKVEEEKQEFKEEFSGRSCSRALE